ncbi:carrier protein, putative [Cryptosporidium muris RN66]|uniref:Carrier protein, putative n=1 Tax=Cryptosporidium muris (strain RN66) TaxID=441375 RepID=B6AGL7_CRYMR|nr:carrier protein, putative [Cryptosporidium muris RN66]EEA07358.1 carrier protein, putative [Cryptosporidium muris RN66]|eukprot:XP_002141707.1 carrier protein [Cryptosporidium muris RN66]
MEKRNDSKLLSNIKTIQPFIVGGLAGCCATTCIQPIDMVKVRIQLAGEHNGSKNPFIITKDIIRNNGIRGLYKGLDAGLVRQITYTTARLGLFRVVSDSMKKNNEPLPVHTKAMIGLSAGGIAAIIGNPADLSLIRLQTDSTLPPQQRRHYKGVFNAMSRIIKDEGVLSLWRGSTPTVIRAMALNMGMLASFDQTKEILQPKFGDTQTTSLIASAISGIFAVTFSLPFDLIKTRLQKMAKLPNGQMPYLGFIDCATKIYRNEGLLGFFAGYPTYYFRIAPHTMITLLCVDWTNSKISNFYKNHLK